MNPVKSRQTSNLSNKSTCTKCKHVFDFLNHIMESSSNTCSSDNTSDISTNQDIPFHQAEAVQGRCNEEDHPDEQEPSAHYYIGGYHPVNIGDYVNNDKYLILRKLGWDELSTHWLSRDMLQERYVMVKIFMSSEPINDCAQRYINTMTLANKDDQRCNRLDSLIDHFEVKGINGIHKCLVMDVMGECLSHYMIRHEFTGLPLAEVKIIIEQILEGLHFIHTKLNKVHSDIQPETIMFKASEEYIQTLVYETYFALGQDELPFSYKCNLPRYLQHLMNDGPKYSLIQKELMEKDKFLRDINLDVETVNELIGDMNTTNDSETQNKEKNRQTKFKNMKQIMKTFKSKIWMKPEKLKKEENVDMSQFTRSSGEPVNCLCAYVLPSHVVGFRSKPYSSPSESVDYSEEYSNCETNSEERSPKSGTNYFSVKSSHSNEASLKTSKDSLHSQKADNCDDGDQQVMNKANENINEKEDPVNYVEPIENEEQQKEKKHQSGTDLKNDELKLTLDVYQDLENFSLLKLEDSHNENTETADGIENENIETFETKIISPDPNDEIEDTEVSNRKISSAATESMNTNNDVVTSEQGQVKKKECEDEDKLKRNPSHHSYEESETDATEDCSCEHHCHCNHSCEESKSAKSSGSSSTSSPETHTEFLLSYCKHYSLCKYINKQFKMSHYIPNNIQIVISGLEKLKDNNGNISEENDIRRQYKAVELIFGNIINSKADVWSTACLLFEMVTGDYLFNPSDSRYGSSIDDEHAFKIIKLVGKIPEELFESNKAKSIKDLLVRDRKYVSMIDPKKRLYNILTKTYHLSPDNAKRLTKFMIPMLRTDPRKRVAAEECINKWFPK